MRTVQLTTADGHELTADIAMPADDEAAVGGVAICHPHPQFGGNRFNDVVAALFDALPTVGFVTLRFDFRAAFGGGESERRDIVAALDELTDAGVAPLFVVGYSFGASVALATADERVAAVAAVAPPLTMMPVATPTVPVLVLSPRHDQFCPPDDAATATRDWPDVELGVVESADHFLAGHTAAVAQRVSAWLTARA